MKFEIFDNGVLQPIEFILATIWLGFWLAIILSVGYLCGTYIPWFTQEISIQNWLYCLLVLNCFWRK